MAIRRLTQRGELLRMGRGLYARPGHEPTAQHALAVVAARAPNAVVCLLSALSFHGLTTQQPNEVWIALPGRAWRPALDWPPLRVVRASGLRFQADIEQHLVEGVELKVYGVTKTIVDCFRLRREVGLDVALEALRESLRARRTTRARLAEMAQQQGIAKSFRPYLEAI